MLVHRKFAQLWEQLPERVGLESAQQFYDHIAHTPGVPPKVNSSTVLRGKAGKPKFAGGSRTIHYEISGAGRIDYQHVSQHTGGAHGDPRSGTTALPVTHEHALAVAELPPLHRDPFDRLLVGQARLGSRSDPGRRPWMAVRAVLALPQEVQRAT
ncbi:MAG: hypothetical protein ACR2KP_04930 [Egibacteraceae bacterium]